MATSWSFTTTGVSRNIDSTLRRGSRRLDFTYEAEDATRFSGAPRSAAFVIATIEVLHRLVCRGYDCREDARIWEGFEKAIPDPQLANLI